MSYRLVIAVVLLPLLLLAASLPQLCALLCSLLLLLPLLMRLSLRRITVAVASAAPVTEVVLTAFFSAANGSHQRMAFIVYKASFKCLHMHVVV
jgi:hypothetical protein